MKQKIIQQGAEAVISLNKDNEILKKRVSKSYRIKELDEKLIKRRTKSESKIITKLQDVILVPKIFKTDKSRIIMQHINGKKLSDNLEKLDYKKISKQIGEILTKIHNKDIIHGDLTTSNMIEKDNKIYLIDFGLGFLDCQKVFFH
jgi:Kae1-associated kinase Bud32